ncbi:hypothetical protein ACFVU0_18090 [Streptomyces sp. NPDC058122]|uniref:hypothetical protein n=1 Tax=Streptomyces sp. NPDC058122 TaxID=3346349 RepID=UPI0036EA31A6
MSESELASSEAHPIPRDRPDQQASENDPFDIETMLRHAQQAGKPDGGYVRRPVHELR